MFSYQSPIPGAVVTSGWGRPREYRDGWHEGFDFSVPEGTPVGAIAAGTVRTSTVSSDAAGEYMSILHPDGTLSRYLHLSKRLLSPGTKVRAGQTIGLSGSTGIQRSAAHLHFDLRANAAALAAYKARYGTPRRSANGALVAEFGRNMSGFVGIPAEPLVPAVLAPAVVASAKRLGLPLYAGLGMGSVLVLAAVAAGSYYAYKRA